MIESYGIKIELERDGELSDFAKKLLKEYYMLPDEKSPQEAFARAAVAYSEGDMEFAQRIYEYASKQWFMFSSPVLSNAPKPGGKWKALPISCFLTYVPDTLEGLIEHTSELRWLSVKGGGVGGHWSDIRSVSRKSPGPIPFLKTVDADMTAYRQGYVRRGSYAAYLDIKHPDIMEFMSVRVPTGGDPNRKCFNLHNAVNITDEFMKAVVEGQDWDLIDPADNTVRETIPARSLWQKLLETRFRTGEPYLNFIDAANRGLPQSLKDKGLKINGSNLCNEIHLPTNEDRTAVCCLSSLNLEFYEDWRETIIVEDLIRFLDNVLSIFIEKAPDEIYKAKYSAIMERSLGLGAMGFHALLQKNNIPWESAIAKGLNMEVFKLIQERAIKSTEEIAKTKSECEDMKGTGRRNSHLLAIAPNANSSIILNTSPSIEPWKSNAYTHRTRAGSFLVKNKFLEKIIDEKILDEKEKENIWSSITLSQGSVQHLDILDDWQKKVFKTAFEIDQAWVVEHASDRQAYICQGQSVNLFFPAGAEKSYVNYVHLKAWKQNLKGLYYLRTSAGVVADKVSQKIERQALADYAGSENEECIACEG